MAAKRKLKYGIVSSPFPWKVSQARTDAFLIGEGTRPYRDWTVLESLLVPGWRKNGPAF
jgi:hypothetical protein